MIISNIIIENFRCYYGKSEISFNQNGKSTLIYGDSGYGKSSFYLLIMNMNLKCHLKCLDRLILNI